MKVFSRVVLLALIVGGSYYFLEKNDVTLNETIQEVEETYPMEEDISTGKPSSGKLADGKSVTLKEQKPETVEVEEGLRGYIGEKSDVLIEAYGEPIRRDPSSYGYESWIYTDEKNHYMEFGVDNGIVSMIYAAGGSVILDTVQIGDSYDQINKKFNFANKVVFLDQESSYRFQLNKEDMQMRPLVQLDEDTFLQLYFDSFENKLSSVRFLTTNIVLMHRPYEIYYETPLPAQPDLTEEEWQTIQSGMEQQVFELTNVIRYQYGVRKLKWDETAAEVASGHSKDMYDNNYFSHYSLDGRGLRERLSELNVQYYTAGENIAAQYTDSPAAVEGWLNSEGHREALLNNSYTHLGVGVYRYFYTQNFLQKS